MHEGAAIFQELAECGRPVPGARVFEVGTGHRINMPLAFYLAGARSIVTVDLNRILKPDLVMESLREILGHKRELLEHFTRFEGRDAVEKRFTALESIRTFDELTRCIGVDYRAPADAASTGLPAGSVDIHFSYTVLEHVPGPVIVGILQEASRLLAADGLICHHIDLSDHFSHSDKSIGRINFLQFSSAEWSRIQSEKFGYQSRLRETDYVRIYDEADQEVIRWIKGIDQDSIASLRNGFQLASEFRGVAPEVLATTIVRAISRPKQG